jgi:hypothetical protein
LTSRLDRRAQNGALMTREFLDLLSPLQIPETKIAILAGAERPTTVGQGRKIENRAFVTFEPGDFLVGGEVPNHDRASLPSIKKSISKGRECDGKSQFGADADSYRRRPLIETQDMDRAHPGQRQRLAVARNGKVEATRSEFAKKPAGGRLPQPRRVLNAPRKESISIGREGDRLDQAAVAADL